MVTVVFYDLTKKEIARKDVAIGDQFAVPMGCFVIELIQNGDSLAARLIAETGKRIESVMGADNGDNDDNEL